MDLRHMLVLSSKQHRPHLIRMTVILAVVKHGTNILTRVALVKATVLHHAPDGEVPTLQTALLVHEYSEERGQLISVSSDR